MDYAELLREERTKAHSVFHDVILSIRSAAENSLYTFFEGEDDPSFYLPHIRANCESENITSYICSGRDEVLKVFELLTSDGRALGRSLFFVDKDHSEFFGCTAPNSDRLFETEWYSIENYVAIREVFDGFWVETLHLDSTDARRELMWADYEGTYKPFLSTMRTIIAMILLARGLLDGKSRRINLNNAPMDHILELDFANRTCAFKSGGEQAFIVATMVDDRDIHFAPADVTAVIDEHLVPRAAKVFLRGKYELWFFVKFLQTSSRLLSSKAQARIYGHKRATPKVDVTHATAMELLASKLRCPRGLSRFLRAALATRGQISPANAGMTKVGKGDLLAK